ncbi:MAG: 50S ribosomal protein L6 [Verrucomicrobiota bacterium]
MSRVGNKVIALPDKVKIAVDDGSEVTVEGPKGKLSWTLPQGIAVEQEEGNVKVTRENDKREKRALHGTARSLIQNMIKGVSEGFVKELEIQGVGFRAAVKGKDLDLNLGKSHPILHPIPEGLTVTVDENTKIKVEGIDKQSVGQFAADVRAYYPPEPYKGKGVRYVGEYVRRKAGKSVAK